MENKELLQRAASEIKSLRREREIMKAKLDMFDAIMSALHGKPAYQSEGAMSPDIVWEIERVLASQIPNDNG